LLSGMFSSYIFKLSHIPTLTKLNNKGIEP
jgi:hypothetical protein